MIWNLIKTVRLDNHFTEFLDFSEIGVNQKSKQISVPKKYIWFSIFHRTLFLVGIIICSVKIIYFWSAKYLELYLTYPFYLTLFLH